MILTWSKGPADDNMPQALLVETLEKVRQHPWWLARAKLAVAVLSKYGVIPPARIVDVGCGWGVNLSALEQAGYEVSGLDISRQILQCIDLPARRLIEGDLNQPLPPDIGLSDGLLALDVIEHLDDDQSATRQFARLLRPGGTAVVSVPARPDLFSDFDRIQGHRRRYLPNRLRESFAGSQLEVLTIFWWGAWMVPILRRMRSDSRKPGDGAAKTYADYLRLPPLPARWVMKLLYAWEESRALKGQLNNGTSLFAVATRRP
jgi:SAM-dependent methyltransferase